MRVRALTIVLAIDSGVYPQGVKQSVYQWSVGPDDYGTETLSLSTTDGNPYGRFHRWED